MDEVTFSLKTVLDLSDEEFFQVCQDNRDLRFERNAKGDLTVMTPAGSDTGRQNAEFNTELVLWNRSKKLGVVFDSSAGFKLPNGANRSPDASWILKPRWESLTLEEQQKFAPICPDFVMELMSPSDNLPTLDAKMQEYLDNGCRLGWLINPKQKLVRIYRPEQSTEMLNSPLVLSGEDILPGFTLNLSLIW